MPTVMYLRKSRADELADTVEETLKRHRQTLEAFAAKNNLIISEIYEEVVSGDSLYARPQMLRLLQNVEAGDIDGVLCMDIDRLGRGAMSEQGIILETFKASGVKIITPRKVYDLDNEIDETYSEFETFMARQELKTIKRRMQRGIKKTIEEGGYIANAPFGYDKCSINKLPSLKINEDEAHFIRMIFDMYVEQGAGCQIIADTINSLGARPRRTSEFGRTTVRSILRNPVYIGKIVWNRKKQIRPGASGNEKTVIIRNAEEKWTVLDGKHAAIISQALYDKAQEILSGRYHPPYYKGTVVNPLAGVVKCQKCGRNMQRRPNQKRQAVQLLCTKKGCCKASNLELVEQAALKEIAELLTVLKREQTQEGNAKKRADLEKALASLTREQELNARQIDRLHDLLERGEYTIDTFNTRLLKLTERRASMEDSGRLLQVELQKSSGTSRQKAISEIENTLLFYNSADAQNRNMLLKKCIEKIEYRKEKDWGPSQFELTVHLKEF